MAPMILETAVSAPKSPKLLSCLLPEDLRETYRCGETAEKMCAADETTRDWAYWHHYVTHCEAYTHLTELRNLGEPTLKNSDPYEAAREIVFQTLLRFRHALRAGWYQHTKGPPCIYIKRSIRNLYQDLLKRGRHPSAEECESCWRMSGNTCMAFRRAETPWLSLYQRCYRLLNFDSLDAGPDESPFQSLQDTWPPTGDQSDIEAHYPVENLALNRVVIAQLPTIMLTVLSTDQYTVILETFWGHKSSQEIGLLLNKTPASVDQIRKRALKRLSRTMAF